MTTASAGRSDETVPLPDEVRRGLPALVVGRLVGNVGSRFTYPFLPAIARGLGISPELAGTALSIRELAGLTGPVAGRAIDGGHRRTALVGGLAGAGILLALTGATRGVVAFTIAVTGFAVAKVLYDTGMATWIGDHVPWERRGAVMGVGELAWAGSLLLGVPIVGVVIDTWGWRSAFVLVGAANVLAAVAVWARVDRDEVRRTGAAARLRLLPGALGIYAVMALLSFGIQLVVVAHGFWLEDAFGWSVSAIGAASIVLGVGELAGTALMIAVSDRVGKRRSLLLGSIVLVAPLALLGTASGASWWAVTLLAASVAVFEFTFVSALPLITEIDPEARGAGVGMAVALVTVARAVGTVAGAALYATRGMGWNGALAAACVAAAIVVTATSVVEPGTSHVS